MKLCKGQLSSSALVQEIERFILDNDLNDARPSVAAPEYLRFIRHSGGMSEENQRKSSCTDIVIFGYAQFLDTLNNCTIFGHLNNYTIFGHT